jgi:hypothetical protein
VLCARQISDVHRDLTSDLNSIFEDLLEFYPETRVLGARFIELILTRRVFGIAFVFLDACSVGEVLHGFFEVVNVTFLAVAQIYFVEYESIARAAGRTRRSGAS